MRSNYKRLGNYIREINERNIKLKDLPLLGVSIQKVMMPSIANTIGTDMSTYKLLNRGQFAYGPVTSRNGDKISVALLETHDAALISQAYTSFEVYKTNELVPEYLMMWMRRPEFDRYARFKSHGSAREIFDWDEMCNVQLPIPHIDKQREIVKKYNTIVNRIALNNQLIQKLEATAQAIYKQWFVDFEFPNEEGQPYKSSGGEMIESELGEIPKGWREGTIKDIANQYMGFAFPGDLYANDVGISVLRGENVSERFLRWDNHKKWNNEVNERIHRCFLEKNDIVIGMDGSKVGKNWAIVSSYDLPLLLAQRVSCLRGKKANYQSFIFYSMHVLNFEYYVSKVQTGTSIPHISGQQIFNFPVLLPSEDLIVRYDMIASKIISCTSAHSIESQRLLDIKDLLLSKLATIEN